jgi:excisionase family DNA binding protein
MSDEKYLKVAEVAKLLRKSPRTVEAWCRDGKIGATKAGQWLIPRESLDDIQKIRR